MASDRPNPFESMDKNYLISSSVIVYNTRIRVGFHVVGEKKISCFSHPYKMNIDFGDMEDYCGSYNFKA